MRDDGYVTYKGGGMASRMTGQSGAAIQINVPITVEGSAGTPEQNAGVARQMAGHLMQAGG